MHILIPVELTVLMELQNKYQHWNAIIDSGHLATGTGQ